MTREDYIKFFKKLLGEDFQTEWSGFSLESIYENYLKEDISYKIVSESVKLKKYLKDLLKKVGPLSYNFADLFHDTAIEKFNNLAGRNKDVADYESFLAKKNNYYFGDLHQFIRNCKYADINNIQHKVFELGDPKKLARFIKYCPEVDVKQIQNLVIEKWDAKQIAEFGLYVENENVDAEIIQQAVFNKRNTVKDFDNALKKLMMIPGADKEKILSSIKGYISTIFLDKPITFYTIAARKAKDTKSFEDIEQVLIDDAIKNRNPYLLHNFAKKVKGAHVDKLIDTLEMIAQNVDEKDNAMRTAIANLATDFATEFKNVDIQKLQQIVMDMGRPHVMYKFAQRVDDVDIDKLKSAKVSHSSQVKDSVYLKALKNMSQQDIIERKQRKIQAKLKHEEMLKNPDASIGDLKECTLEKFAELVESKTAGKLTLDVRSYNCLKRARVHTLYDLLSKTEEDLLKVRNLGGKSTEKVKDCLAVLGLSLKGEEICAEENSTPTFN